MKDFHHAVDAGLTESAMIFANRIFGPVPADEATRFHFMSSLRHAEVLILRYVHDYSEKQLDEVLAHYLGLHKVVGQKVEGEQEAMLSRMLDQARISSPSLVEPTKPRRGWNFYAFAATAVIVVVVVAALVVRRETSELTSSISER